MNIVLALLCVVVSPFALLVWAAFALFRPPSLLCMKALSSGGAAKAAGGRSSVNTDVVASLTGKLVPPPEMYRGPNERPLHQRRNDMNEQTINRPDYHAYNVYTAGQRRRWVRIGAAWNHADGDGLTLRITAFPIDGTVVLRAAQEQPEDAH